MNHKDLVYPCEGKGITVPEEPQEFNLIDLIKRVEALEKCIDTSDLPSLIKSFFDHESLESCYVEQMLHKK